MSEYLVLAGSAASPVAASLRAASTLWGVVVPGLIFAVAFAITWALYRRFAGPKSKD